jgi:hypothetical protein
MSLFSSSSAPKWRRKTRNGDARHRLSHQIPRQVKKKRRGKKRQKTYAKRAVK